MADIAWLKQTPDKPLFPDLLWSRPENKNQAGKLLIAGGNSHSFTAVSNAYAAASKAGVGTARILLPDALAKTLTKLFPEADFGPSTPSGSFARETLAQILDSAQWADGTLLAGDFGKNAETTIVLEGLLGKYLGQVTIAGDSLEGFAPQPDKLLDRPSTALVAELSDLQKLLSGRLLLKHSMDLVQLVEALQRFSSNCPAALITFHNNQIVVAAGGRVSTTPVDKADLVKIAAYAATWWLQNPDRLFEAVSTAVLQI